MKTLGLRALATIERSARQGLFEVARKPLMSQCRPRSPNHTPLKGTFCENAEFLTY